MPARGWQRYVGPAAFLLLATVAILLIRSGLAPTRSPDGVTTSGAGTSLPPSTATATATATTTTASKRFWTVQAGDTFQVIAARSGVPVTTIEHLNPAVRSTSLFIGEKIRIR